MARRLSLLVTLAIFWGGDWNSCCASQLDDDGAPLSEFAIARLGTLRFRHNLRFGSGFATLMFSPDGKIVAATCDKGLAMWDAATGKNVSWFPPNPSIKAAAFTPDGKKLITCSHSPVKPRDFRTELRLLEHWEVGTGKRLRQFEFERNRGESSTEFPMISADGKFLIHTSGKEVVVRDAVIGPPVARVEENLNYWAPFALSKDGATLAIVRKGGINENELCIYDIPGAKLRQRIFRENTAHYATAFSPDGKFLVSACRDSLCVWDPENGKLIREVAISCVRIAFSADGKLMACADRKGIQLYAVPTFAEVRRFEGMPTSVYSLAFSPDGKRLASGHDQVVLLWDVATGKQVHAPVGHQSSVCSLAFSADGKTLASGSDGDGVACLWDVGKRDVRTRLTGHYRAAAAVAISPDGAMIATGDGSPTYQTGGGETHIRLWDLRMKLLRKFPAHINGVTSLDFAPDGKTLVSGGLDARVRLWNVADGVRLGQVRGGDAHHWGQFSRDGKSLLVVDGSGGISLWQTDMKQKLHDLLEPGDRHAPVHLAAFAGDGSRVVAAWSGLLQTWQDGKSIQADGFNAGPCSSPLCAFAGWPDACRIIGIPRRPGRTVGYRESNVVRPVADTLLVHQHDGILARWQLAGDRVDGHHDHALGCQEGNEAMNRVPLLRRNFMYSRSWLICFLAVMMAPSPAKCQQVVRRHAFKAFDSAPLVALSADGKTVASAARGVDTKTWSWTDFGIWDFASHEKRATFKIDGDEMAASRSARTAASSSVPPMTASHGSGRSKRIANAISSISKVPMRTLLSARTANASLAFPRQTS